MEKTVAVKLLARTSQYMAAMAAASKATTGLATSASGLERVGSSMQSVGANMTRYVSVPLVALGGAATLMASRFETSFAQMVGLANVPASEVDHLRESVLSLAGETARGPQELADALYLAASSGLDSADAMDVVSVAAKAAAAGMGSTTDVVNLLTGAIGSYGADNLTAARAVDVLSASVREGRAAPEELAQVMGRILPIASSMGIGIEQVGAALAFLSNTGVDSDIAVTGLRDALVKLDSPGKAAQTALEEMGTSAAELHQAIAQNGLTGALELLRDHGFAGNTQALRELMPDIRGYAALLPLLADENNTLDGIMGRVADSTGSLDTAFNAVASTSAFKMKKAFADIQVALIQIGAVLLPFVATVVGGIGDMVEWFSKLPGPVQDVVIAFGAMAAAAGPVLFIAGSFIKNFQSITSVLKGAEGGVSSMAKTLGVLGIGLAAGLYIFDAFGKSQRDAHDRTMEVSSALGEATTDAWDYATAAAGARDAVDPLTVAQLALSNALTGNTDAGEALTQSLGALGLQTEDAWIVVSGLNKAMNEGTPQDYADFWNVLGVQMGLTGDKLTLFAGVMGNTMPMTAGQLKDAAEAAGFADGEFERLQAGANGLTSSVTLLGRSGVSSLAETFLNTAAATSDLGANLVTLARAQAEAAGAGADSTVVYENFNALLPGLTDAQWDLVMGLGATADAVASATPLWGALWEAATPPKQFAAITTTMAAAQAELNRIASVGPVGESWIAFAENVAGVSRDGKGAVLVLQALHAAVGDAAVGFPELLGQLGLTSAVMGDLGKSTLGAAEQFGKAAPTVKELGVSLAGVDGGGSASEIKQFGDAVGDAVGPVEDMDSIVSILSQSLTDAATAADDFRNAVDQVTGPADDLREATRGVWEEMDNMSESLDENGNSFDDSTKKGRANQEQLEATRDAIIAHGVAMIENGASAEEAAGDIAYNTLQLHDQLIAAGLTEAQVANLIATYGLTPESVNTAIVLAGEAEANRTIDRYNGMLAQIPPAKQTYIQTLIDQGRYWEANAQLDLLAHPRNVALQVQLYGVNAVNAALHSVNGQADGGYISGFTYSTLAEEGPEAVLPLTKPSRMRQLLADPRIADPVAAAMGGFGGSSGGASSGGMSTATFNQYNTINMPPGSDGNDVLRSLRKLQRQSGPLPLAVR